MGILSDTIVDHYYDIYGNRRPLVAETYQAILAAMRVDSEEQLVSDDVIVIRGHHDYQLHQPVDVTLEDRTQLPGVSSLPPDLPFGYHSFRRADGSETFVIKAPQRCHFDPGMRLWAWAVQLYALRSRNSWGQGDLSDLKRFANWSASKGAGAILINPIHASAPGTPQQSSPYYPTSRRFRSPLYLDVTRVPGFEKLDGKDAANGRDLSRLAVIDRDQIWQAKRATLQQLFQVWIGDEEFDDYCQQQGDALTSFATYCALAELHGQDWRQWPSDFRSSDNTHVAAFQRQHERQLQFFCWIQWLLDEQLRDAASRLPLVQDLPIGVDPGGADAWQWQDVLAGDVRIGAPPDHFNGNGQDWGLPPFIPHRLRNMRYQPFIETIRATLRHAGGLRIDHVMGLFRLFWIPGTSNPAGGAYVRYPADELLAIVALESQRANAWIAGEDLGTVEPSVKEKLFENAMLSYRVLWFQDTPPSGYPHLSMAAVTTHDLPTIAGLWTGDDLAYQQSLGLSADAGMYDEMKQRLISAAGIDADTPAQDVLVAAHRALARAPSAVAVANLDDALAASERPNVPGTVSERANWSLPLSKTIEELETDSLVNDVVVAMDGR